MALLCIVVVEDADADFPQVEDFCHEVVAELGAQVKVTRYTSLEDFLSRPVEVVPDLMIVDLRLDAAVEELGGWEAVRPLLAEEVVPVVVYSAFAAQPPPGDEFDNVLVARVKKGSEDPSEFQSKLKLFAALKLRLNAAKECIAEQFAKLTLQTAGAILGQGIPADTDHDVLASMAVGRLASYLLNVPTGGEGVLPPEAAILYPPLAIPGYESCLFLGDILIQKATGKGDRVWIVCTPSCDLVFGHGRSAKVQEVLLLRCYRLHTEVAWLTDKKDATARKCAATDRYRDGTAKPLRCPEAVVGSRSLLASMKDYATVPYAQILEGLAGGGQWMKLATLATPYAESLQNLFLRDLSRIATPSEASRDDEEQWLKEFVDS